MIERGGGPHAPVSRGLWCFVQGGAGDRFSPFFFFFTLPFSSVVFCCCGEGDSGKGAWGGGGGGDQGGGEWGANGGWRGGPSICKKKPRAEFFRPPPQKKTPNGGGDVFPRGGPRGGTNRTMGGGSTPPTGGGATPPQGGPGRAPKRFFTTDHRGSLTKNRGGPFAKNSRRPSLYLYGNGGFSGFPNRGGETGWALARRGGDLSGLCKNNQKIPGPGNRPSGTTPGGVPRGWRAASGAIPMSGGQRGLGGNSVFVEPQQKNGKFFLKPRGAGRENFGGGGAPRRLRGGSSPVFGFEKKETPKKKMVH